MDSKREQFEKWAVDNEYDISNYATGFDGQYFYWNDRTQEAWEGWQAALASLQPAQEPLWYAVMSKAAPIINKAIRSEEVAQEYADKCRENYHDVEIVPLYASPLPQSALSTDAQKVRDQAANNDLTPHLRQYMHNDGSGFVFGYEVAGIDRLVAYLRAKAEPKFESEEDLIAWLDTLHATEGNAVTNHKWEPAQRAIQAIRALQSQSLPSSTEKGADTERLNFLTEFGSTWHVQWEQRPGKPVRYRMIDDGEAWGKWHSTARQAIDAALAQKENG